MADEYPNYRRISDQAALLANIDTIVKLAPKFGEGTETVIKIDANSQSAKNPEISINSLYNFNKYIEAAGKLNSADLSFLIPYIKIYKIYPGKEPEIIPFNNFYPKNAIDNMINGKSDRGYQANLVNVELISQGKDLATTFLYGVKLKIVFDSLATLFTENSQYLKLFNPPKKTGNINPDYYQIGLKFGWNVQTTKAAISAGVHVKDLQTFADLSESMIFLHYILHKVTVNEDGSATLQLEYNGAFDNIARNSNEINILASKNIQKLQKLSKEIEDLEQSVTSTGNKIQADADKTGKVEQVKITDKDGKDVNGYDTVKKQLKQKYNEKNEKTQAGKEEILNSIINGINKFYNNGRMPSLSIDKSIYEKLSEVIEKKEGGSQEASANTASEVARLTSDSKATKHNIPGAFIVWEWPDSTVASSEFNDIKYYENLTLQETQIKNRDGTSVKIPRYNIKYFTFGVLMSAIQALKEQDGKKIVVIGSNIQISKFSDGSVVDVKTISNNPKYQLKVENGLDIKGNYYILENKITNINILDIPIALSTFKTWFLENIVSQNLTNMTLMTFLDSCVNDLLKLAVMPDNQDYIPKQNIKFKYLLDKVFFNDHSTDSIKKLVNGEISITDLMMNVKDQTLKEENGRNVLVFYSSPKFISRKSDYKKDLAEGVPHFFYGNSNGNVKKITFREETIPHFKEANIQAQVDRTPWKPGVFLREKYNILIEMYGTVFYRMGTLIYVSPSFTGMMDKDTAIKFGIGGYFVVVSIKHVVESGKYETVIEANWVSAGDGVYDDLNNIPFQIYKVGAQFKTDSQKLAEKEEADKAKTRLLKETGTLSGPAGKI